MSSLLKNQPGDAQLALCEILPDLRRRLTRYRVLNLSDKVNDDLILPWGTVDEAPADAGHNTEDFAGLRLIKQFMADPGSLPQVSRDKPVWVRVYETIPAADEIQVGGDTLIELEDGRSAIERTFLQFASAPFVTAGPAGTAAAGGVYLRTEEAADDGTLRTIKRTYVESGIVATDDQSLNGGKLLKKTIVSVKTVPVTPAGFTLVGSPVQNPNGLPVYTYTFYKGNGEISRDEDYFQSSDEGATGGTRITITHLTAGSVNVDPTASPGAGFSRAAIRQSDQDGHRVWVVVWAKGTGTVFAESHPAEGGKIVVYHRIGFGAAPDAPDATIGGTVTLTVNSLREADGYQIHDYTWVEGLGEVAKSIDYGQSSDQGTTGSTRVTIRTIVAPGATVQPTSLVGFVDIGPDYIDQEGYRVWVTKWAKGVGLVVDDTSSRSGGKLVIYHRVQLGSAPSAPAPTIGGTVTLIEDRSRKEAGYDVFDYTWAEGVGIVGEHTQTRDGGLLLLNRDILVPPGTTDISAYAPAAGILQAGSGYEDLDGYRRWSATWMQLADGTDPTSGPAVSSQAYVPFMYPGRAKVIAVPFTAFGYTFHRAYDLYLGPPVDALVLATTKISYQASNAVGSLANPLWNPTEWATVYASWIAWANAPRSKVEGLRGYRTQGWSVTGVASTDVLTLNAGSPLHNLAGSGYERVYFSSLTGGTGLAVNTVYYVRDVSGGTLKLAATAGGAAINFTTDITAGTLHLIGGTSIIATGDTSVLGDRVYYATDWQLKVSGGPADPGGSTWTLSARVDQEPAFIGYDGTKYYRLTTIEAAIPAQTALPV